MKPKIAIATPHSGRPIMPQWHVAMQRLMQPRNSIHAYLSTIGLKMDDAYNALAEQSVAIGAEFTLFVDDDTQPPQDMLVELLRVLENAEPDVMVAGGIYTTRWNPPTPHVFMEFGGGPFWRWKAGEVFPCYSLGSGAMLIRNEVFGMIEKPWFKHISSVDELAEHGDLFPELEQMATVEISIDFFFCQKLAKAGFKVMAHGGILPIHWGDDLKPYSLAPDCYPMRESVLKGA